jgi:hypothetical protein
VGGSGLVVRKNSEGRKVERIGRDEKRKEEKREEINRKEDGHKKSKD